MENRKLAWAIVIPLIIISVFIGGYTTYLQTSRRIEAVYRTEAEPVLREKVQLLYNMVTLHQLNYTDEGVTRVVEENIRRALIQIENFEQVDIVTLQMDSAALSFYADDIDEFDESDATRMRSLFIDVNERAEILRQTSYNAMAMEFNSGILGNFGQLPTF